MNTSRKVTKKLYKLISGSFSELSNIVTRSDKHQTPQIQPVARENECFDEPFDQSLELLEGDTVILSRDDYSRLQAEISLLEESLGNSSRQNEEYRKSSFWTTTQQCPSFSRRGTTRRARS